MSFIDELKIHLKAGKGGDGVVRWLNVKGKEYSGPAGGNGGAGGNVYVEAVRSSSILNKYSHKVEMHAADAQPGGDKQKTGADGEDLVIFVPMGSRLTNLETGIDHELLDIGQKVRILKGGKGGLGNVMFKGPVNRTPLQQTDGKLGEEADFFIEVRLIADFGLIGLPNAGKSTLLNLLTNSKSKIGNYNFTTLEPHLGDMYGIIIADIPGLIEGASDGKGLGHKFLRHIQRTKALLHCISGESFDFKKDYETIRGELKAFNPDLILKEEVILITKSDTLEEDRKEEIKKLFKDKEVMFVSIIDDESIVNLKSKITSSVDN